MRHTKESLATVSLGLFLVLLLGAGDVARARNKAPQRTHPTNQVIHGTTYENAAGHFTLAIPKDWIVSDVLTTQVPGVIGALAAPGGSIVIMVQRYYVPGSKAGVQILDDQFKSSFRDYHKLGETALKVDGKDAYSFTFHALFPFGSPGNSTQLPAKLWVVLIPDGESVLGFTCEAPESDFDEIRPVLEKIVRSFRASTR